MNILLLALSLFAVTALGAQSLSVALPLIAVSWTKDGNGYADDGGSNERDELLSAGDMVGNGYWRSVLLFDLSGQVDALRSAKRVELILTVKNILGTPMPIQVVNLSSANQTITISTSGGPNDDFTRKGTVITASECAMLQAGDELSLDITKAVHDLIRSGERQLRLRLQTELNNNDNPHNDRVSFLSGSHGVNAAAGAARLAIER